MVVEQSNIDHIMRGLQSAEGVRLHNHRKKLRQRFDIIKKLGQGTYGKVQLGINKETGQEVAIKAIKKCKIETEADLVRIRREIQIMSSVRHPNIIHIYEVFENREKMVLVMEYAAGGELYDFLSERKVLEEPEARRIFRQISTAVYYCHKHKICHRDLKLENILLDQQGNAKIADFGLSNVYDEQHLLNSFCGSPLYASPEIVKGTPYYGPEVDCWSLGVLLYTLVYGAMPFDGSNFKRLVKQISQGVYFEPENPSSASPLIREMLTVNPKKRATIEQICSHWWVNQGFNVSCLDIAEDLANQTPVRLDLLLSLAPPPENSEKLVVTDSQSTTSQDTPARSLSVGSFMELDPNTEQRIREFVAQEVPSDSNEKTVKRKLETDASESSIKKEAARKKERTKLSEQLKETEFLENDGKSANKENNNNHIIMDVDKKSNKTSPKEDELSTDISAKNEQLEISEKAEKMSTDTKMDLTEHSTKSVEMEKVSDSVSKDKPNRKSVKLVKKKVLKDTDGESKDNETKDSKIKVKKKKKDEELEVIRDTENEIDKTEQKPEIKEKENIGREIKRESATRKSQSTTRTVSKEDKEKIQPVAQSDEGASAKLPERRKSKIFETAEKFMANDSKSPSQEKPKKMFIPGVKVSDFAKAFERRSSLTNVSTPKTSTSKKSISKEVVEKKIDDKEKECAEIKKECVNSSRKNDNLIEEKAASRTDSTSASPEQNEGNLEEPQTEKSDEKLKNLKDLARNIISSALVEEERKKIKKQICKPPAAKTKLDDSENKRPLTLQLGKETATVHIHSPENTKFLFDPQAEASGENKENVEASKEKKTTKMEITLKSNTLPRGASSKTEGRLKTPPAQGLEKSANFRTEVEQRVGDPHTRFTTQRSEVTFPVSAAQRPVRSMSLEPEIRRPQSQIKERIIPIQLEDGGHKEENEARDRVRDLAERTAEGKSKVYQRTLSQRSASLSRQSTQDSDIECPTAPGEAIKKSPREFIIPIAVEGGGYVTPRATSLEPSDNNTSKRGIRPFSRKISLWSDNGSEDESPFPTLQRHPSHDFDEPFRLHRLRSSRPMRASVEKADSASGSEEEEDDDGFEILTAENLFSTLLSRVRSLTQRLNVEGGLRPGFPSSRLMNHFGPSERLLSNFHQPLRTRISERPDFARSFSRDIENGLNRWNRGDLNNSDSTRSLTRDSKSRRSESDTESISETNSSSSRKKIKSQGQKSSKRSSSQMKTKALPKETDSESQYDSGFKSAVFDNKSNSRLYQNQVSDSEFLDPLHTCRSLLHRTASLKSDKTRKQCERKSIGICEKLDNAKNDDKSKNFYDILAEKYGITNAKRYDLIFSEDRNSNKQKENAFDSPIVGSIIEVKNPKNSIVENIVDKVSSDKQTDVLPPIPPKVKKEDSEKYKTPSEKLAAVLNRLEERKKVKAEKKENSLSSENTQPQAKPDDFERTQTIDKNRLATLSPEALELYEKTLAFYEKKHAKEIASETSGKPARSGIPRKIPTRQNSEIALKEIENNYEKKMVNRDTPERSVLSKYLNDPSVLSSKLETSQKNIEDSFKEKKLRHYDSLRSRLREQRESTNGKKEEIKVNAIVTLPMRKSLKEDETSQKKNGSMSDSSKRLLKDSETGKGNDKEEKQKPGKSKLFSSLEKRFEKFCSDKKYVDKAIRSLRESSLGPKDVSSENVLIKRAVSLSDCSAAKTVQKGKIQSTVNSVLGMFKKIESSEVANSTIEASKEESKIPQKRPSLKIDLTRDDKSKGKIETMRRSSNISNSFICQNDLSPNRSPSSLPGFDDSSSMKSPDSESFDSWSNCSDLYSPDDFSYKSLTRHCTSNFDEMSTESVSERIRRKSFYSRFNERRKPRRSSILEGWKKYDAEEGSSCTRQIENNLSSGDITKKYDERRPKPFCKPPETETSPYRKISLDLSKDMKIHSFNRDNSQSSITSSYATLSRSYKDSYSGSRIARISDSVYRMGSNNLERSLSPTRPFSPTRALSPNFGHSSNQTFD